MANQLSKNKRLCTTVKRILYFIFIDYFYLCHFYLVACEIAWNFRQKAIEHLLYKIAGERASLALPM